MAHLQSLVVLDASSRHREALVFGFEREGYRVLATEQPEKALGLFRSGAAQLLIASVEGRGGSTVEVLSAIAALRESDATSELPVVVLGEPPLREEALRAGADEFVKWPAFIRDVVTLSRLAVALRQDGDDAGLVGLLEDYGLYFLSRALSVAGRSGVLELERERRVGEVHIVKGEVVQARVGRMSGVPAFCHLLLWGEAQMQLRLQSPAGERKISVAIDRLLATGVEFAREFERLAQRIGGPQAVYAPDPNRAEEARSQIPPEVWMLMKEVDGRKTLIDLVEDSPFKPFDTIKIAFRLAELGAITKLESARAISPLTAQLAVRDWLLGAGDNGPRSTVTEAGRRAAEAYAEAQARREKGSTPADDILNDRSFSQPPAESVSEPPPGATLPVAVPPPLPSDAPPLSIEDLPTAPRTVAPPSSTSVPPASPSATGSGSRVSATPPKKKSSSAKNGGAAAKSRRPAKPQLPPGKLSADAVLHASPKEPVFDAVEEEFFAREAELSEVEPVEHFDDLEPHPTLSAKRRWSLFGERPTPAPKKR